MIKRPLLWMLAAYSMGIILYRHTVIVLLLAVVYLILYAIFYRFNTWVRIFLQNKNRFLVCLPLFFLLGCLLMGKQSKLTVIESLIQEETMVEATGKINAINHTKYGMALYLTNSVIKLDGNEYQCKGIIAYCSEDETLKIGNVVYTIGTAVPLSEAENPGQFDERQYDRAQNIVCKLQVESLKVTDSSYSVMKQFFYEAQRRLVAVYTRILPEKQAGLMSALILGDKSMLAEDTKELYQANGIAHILVISGLNISMLGLGLYALIRRLKSPLLTSILLTMLLITAYGMLTGLGISTARAVIMMIIALFAKLLGRSYDMMSSASLCALILLFYQPMQLFQAGFLLSFAAIYGIALFGREFGKMKLIEGKTFLQKIMKAFLECMSAQLMIMPVIVQNFYELPVYAPILNLIVIPLSTLLVFLGLLAAIVGMVFPLLAELIIGGAYFILRLYEWLCILSKKLPYHTWLFGKPEWYQHVIYYIVLLLFYITALYLGSKKCRLLTKFDEVQKRRVACMIFLLLPLCLIKGKEVQLNVTFLSVGQGDSIYLESAMGSDYLMDGGSTSVSKVGKYRIEPFLKASGVYALEAVIISHSDMDHINGIIELLEGMEDVELADAQGQSSFERKDYKGTIGIKTLILPAAGVTNESDENYDSLITLAKQKGVPIRYITQGDSINEGELSLTCLHPAMDFRSDSINAYSTVLSVNYKNFDLLLTGDVEPDGEEAVLEFLNENQGRNGEESGENGKGIGENSEGIYGNGYDILKVSHHGSRNSTSVEFLQQIAPAFSVISCGRGNMYGHPHTELLQRLKDIQCETKITYMNGAVKIETDGCVLHINEYMN